VKFDELAGVLAGNRTGIRALIGSSYDFQIKVGLAERLYELVRYLPEDKAAEVLDFAEYVNERGALVTRASRDIDFSVFDQVKATYDGEFNRAALYDRACLR